jgi:Ca2+-binding RTX toxin-like protein
MATINGTPGDDNLVASGDPSDTFNGGAGNDSITAGPGDDTLNGEAGDDVLTGGGGADVLSGGDGADRAIQNVTTDGADSVNLGDGLDVVSILASAPTNVRLAFTSAEVGNGNPNDGNSPNPPQDGGLALRLQAETNGTPEGALSRYDDEGITFVGGPSVTFDVRDLVSGAQRGEAFEVVVLGTSGADTLDVGVFAERPYYFNGGQGNDVITGGNASDFLVGGGGDDVLVGGSGENIFIGGGGNDLLRGGAGVDRVAFNVTTDGSDTARLGDGDDVVTVSAASATNVRLAFVSAEVGNGFTDFDAFAFPGLPDEPLGPAVRLRAEVDGSPQEPTSFFDDEGITFVAGAGVTFDVRDLVLGTERGELFEVVVLGSADGDFLTALQPDRPYYFNAGSGNDFVTGGNAADFIVGGAGDDTLSGGAGQDTFLGGGGADTINSVDRPSGLFDPAIAPERDVVDGGAGDDVVTGGRLDQLTGGAGNDFLQINFDFNGPFTENPPPARPAVALTLDASGTGTANDGTFITGFERVDFTLTDNADTVNTGDVTATLSGGGGDDVLTTGAGDDRVFGGDGSDAIRTGAGNDTVSGGANFDFIDTGDGDDTILFDPSLDGFDNVNTGQGGNDTVRFESATPGQIRVTFTSAEVGNGSVLDGGTLANQDGFLAVRVQREDGSGALIGEVSRYDDEGITFIEGTQGFTFDVRDLVSGAERGDQFAGVVLGTVGADTLTFFPPFRSAQPFYYNAGQGNDTVTGGSGNDFLVGGGGDDVLVGGFGENSFIGGGGNDVIFGDSGVDRIAAFNVTTDGADTVNLGANMDVVNVTATSPTNVRLSFTSGEVGNGNANDSNTTSPPQDGGLAVRLQAETGGAPGGPLSRFDDEGITFVGGAGVTFDVRDLVSGAQRGEQFEVVVLGTNGADVLTAQQADRPYYFNAGMGDDVVTGGAANDFLVGGAGDDVLVGGFGENSFIGGGGNDVIFGDSGVDRVAAFNVTTDGADTVNLGAGADVVTVTATTPTNVRLSFTSGEVGNGNANDSNTTSPPQDGGLAVRLQGEDGAGALTGPVSRFDDEGITFVGGAGVTFDVRDLVSGAQRGEQFEVVVLGTNGADALTAVQADRSYYFNAGQGNDTVTGGARNDFLVGGAGDDLLIGGLGDDSFIGGAGNDLIFGEAGVDRIAAFNVSTDGADQVNLGEGIDIVNISAAAGVAQVRLTFDGAAIGNNDGNDASGSLAIQVQAEDDQGGLSGTISRFDDEGVIFVATGAGLTFDTRVSGVPRGDTFRTVGFGSHFDDTFAGTAEADYLFGGLGNDTITGGGGNDFLVGQAGDDVVSGGEGVDIVVGGDGNDTLSGGAGNDTILGGNGDDRVLFSVSNDGLDSTDTGAGSDTVIVDAAASTNIRLTFTSAEVGNGVATEGTTAPQDGGLAVRLQAEAGGEPTGPQSRFDDEGVTFVGGAGVTFDVRDLLSGVGRGEAFEIVVLGTSGADTLSAVSPARPYYFNGGMGADVITGGSANDFLVGGAGDDVLIGGFGENSFIGGAGSDVIFGDSGTDTIAAFNVTTDGADRVNLGDSMDVVNVSKSGGGQVRLSFTSAEVGNGVAFDSGSMANQDLGLAVRLQAEDGGDAVTGPQSRFDDEGVTFVAAAGTVFEVRDLVSNVVRGQAFEVVVLGAAGADTLTAFQNSRPYYINAGLGNDQVFGGLAADFLVGGGGDDLVLGGEGGDTVLAGGGNDFVEGGGGDDRLEGGVGSDALIGGFGSDIVFGDAGDDYLQGDDGQDVLEGGDGADELHGGAGNDVLGGDAGDDTLAGEGGDDALYGDEGDDYLSGGDGDDLLEGRDGADRLVGDNGNDALIGGAGNDQAEGFSGGDYITGNDGDDLLIGHDGRDELLGGAGADLLYGGADADILSGETGADFLYGGLGDDYLAGGAEGDVLVGEEGNDYLLGGGGADFMVGGAGADVFAFMAASESTRMNLDVVFDFESGVDRLDLSALRTGAGSTVTTRMQDGYTLVFVDQDGDGVEEFVVQVNGAVGAGDFLF